MDNKPAVIFPYSFVSEPVLQKLIGDFGEVTICQPWFMKGFNYLDQDGPALGLNIARPPESLKPHDDFEKLLSEYRSWASQNKDWDAAFLFEARRTLGFEENGTWNLRREIKSFGKKHDLNPAEDQVLKWHLILHLTRIIQENRTDEEQLIAGIKQKASPLIEAFGDESPPQELFKDLPSMENHPVFEKHHIVLVLDAWIGLFSLVFPPDGHLIALDPQILNHLSEMFEGLDQKISDISQDAPDVVHKQPGSNILIQRDLPMLPDGHEKKQDPVFHFLAGKRILYMRDA